MRSSRILEWSECNLSSFGKSRRANANETKVRAYRFACQVSGECIGTRCKRSAVDLAFRAQ
eukprot:scaffold168104_cov28-Tisochrysis_lutea.AAC.2